jgi:hypothetical protein
LLTAVLTTDCEFWKSEKVNHEIAIELFKKNESQFTPLEMKKEWNEVFKNFEETFLD